MFASQQIKKAKKHKPPITSSAPQPSKSLAKLMEQYPNLVFFKWGGDIHNPFELVKLESLNPNDIDTNWVCGILSEQSRKKHRDIKSFPDYLVSVFSKIEKRK